MRNKSNSGPPLIAEALLLIPFLLLGSAAVAPAGYIISKFIDVPWYLLSLVLITSSLLSLWYPVEYIAAVLSRKSRKPSKEELVRFKTVIETIERKAGIQPRKWIIVVEKSSSLNAFTSGRHTLGVTTAALALSNKIFEAVIAHELGHQLNRDTWSTAIRAWVMSPLRLIVRVAQAGGFLFAAAAVFSGAALFPAALFALTVWFASIPVLLLMPLTAYVQRRNEIAADAVASALGYRDELASMIMISQKDELTGWKRLTASHPEPENRLQALYR